MAAAIPTFNDLLKKAKQPPPPPKPPVAPEVTPGDAGLNLPPGWKVQQSDNATHLLSPSGNIFKDFQVNPDGSKSFKVFNSKGTPVKLPETLLKPVSGDVTAPAELNPFPKNTVAGKPFLQQPSGEPVRDMQGNIVFKPTAAEKYQQQVESEANANRIKQSELYQGNVNPIVSFANTPTKVFGLTPADIVGIGTLAVSGAEAIKSLTEFQRLPQYKAMESFAKDQNIPKDSPVFTQAKDTLKTAYNLYKQGATDAADEIMARFNQAYEGTAQAVQAENPLALGTRPIPRATQSGALSTGNIGQPAEIMKRMTTQALNDSLLAAKARGKAIGLDVEAVQGIKPTDYWVSITANTKVNTTGDEYLKWLAGVAKDNPNQKGLTDTLQRIISLGKKGVQPAKGGFLPFKNLEDAQKFLDTGDTSLVLKSLNQQGKAWTPAQRAATEKALAREMPVQEKRRIFDKYVESQAGNIAKIDKQIEPIQKKIDAIYQKQRRSPLSNSEMEERTRLDQQVRSLENSKPRWSDFVLKSKADLEKIAKKLGQPTAPEVTQPVEDVLKAKQATPTATTQEVGKATGEQIASSLGVKYDGVQQGYGDIPDKMQFTDPITGSTTYGNSLDEVKANIEAMRAKFAEPSAQTSQLKALGWSDVRIATLDQTEIGNILRRKITPADALEGTPAEIDKAKGTQPTTIEPTPTVKENLTVQPQSASAGGVVSPTTQPSVIEQKPAEVTPPTSEPAPAGPPAGAGGTGGLPPTNPPSVAEAQPNQPVGVPSTTQATNGIQDTLDQAKAIVARDKPGIITRIADRIPGIKQVQRGLHPSLGMPDNMVEAWVGKGHAQATVSNSLHADLLPQLDRLESVFGKGATGGEKLDIQYIGDPAFEVPFSGTLYDILQRPLLYDLTAEQRTLIETIRDERNLTFSKFKDSFNLDIGQFKSEQNGVHLANVDYSKTATATAGSEQRALQTGRAKERFYDTGADRYLHDKVLADAGKIKQEDVFSPNVNVGDLLNADDETLAAMAAQNVFKTGLGGKTKLELMEILHPKLYKKMTALRARLTSLKGTAGRLNDKQRSVIDDFLGSAYTDENLTQLQSDLVPELKTGKNAGKNIEDINKEISGIKKQIQALQPAWRTANPRGFVFVQDGGIYRYFPTEDAKQIHTLTQTSNNKALSVIDEIRATAFGGDLSPGTIQGLNALLYDPLTTARSVAKELGMAVGDRNILRPFTADALSADIKANPEAWQRFTLATGINPMGNFGREEFGTGYISKIPKVGKVWEQANDALFRGLIKLQQNAFESVYQAGIKVGQTPQMAAALAADDVTKIIPSYSYRRLGLSQAQAANFRAALTSVSFLTQPAALMTDATKGFVRMGTLHAPTPSESYAMKRVLTVATLVSAIAMISAAIYAKNHGKDPEAMAKASINPNDPYFWSLVLPDGSRIGLGGPMRSLIKAIAPGKVGKLPYDLPFAGFYQFMMNKMHPALRIVYDEIRNKDYFGQTIRSGDFPVNILQGLEYAVEGVVPLSAGSAMEDIRRGKQTNIPGDVASQLAGVNLSPPPAGAREKLPAAFSNLGKVDQAELDAALKTAKKQNASPSKIAEIKAADHTYNVKSLRRDITAAIKYSLPREITALNSPLTNALVNFNAQSDNYDKLSNNEQEAYLKANPDYAAQRIFWGELTTVPTLKNAQDASVLAKQYGIPLNLVPAFSLTDKGKERIPLEYAKTTSLGQYGKGNIDLTNRPHVTTPDGIATVRSISFEQDGQEILVPTVSEDGRIMSNQEAIDQYNKTGKYLGKFNSVTEADKYAEELHNSQADFINPTGINESLAKAYFNYNALPASSYLAMSQSQVDAGLLPDKYLKDWQTYQKLKTDVAKSAFRNSHKEASKSTWRDDFRKKNPEFDKWLQENKDMKPLYTKTVTMRSGSGNSIRTTSIGSSGISAPARQKATVRKPSFKTASARRGLKIGTPRVARA